MNTSFIKIGRIVATFGLNGDIVIKHILQTKKNIKKLEVLFIEEKKDLYIPYFIRVIIPKNVDEIQVQLEDIRTKEEANKLLQKNILLPESKFNELVNKSSLTAIIGYSVINYGELLGRIHALIEQPHQILIILLIDFKEVFIPLHQETLIKIDNRSKIIYVNIPDGLLDVYLT